MRKRWLWVGVIALAVLLVPALLWSGRRAASPTEENNPPPALADKDNDQQSDSEGQASSQTKSRLYVVAVGAGLSVLDGATGAVEQTLVRAVLAPDASLLYTVSEAGGQTRVQAVETGTGRVTGEMTLAGSYDLPWIGFLPSGLSPNGRWLVLQHLTWLEEAGSRGKGSRFAVVDLSFKAPTQTIDLDGQFEFDALNDDGTRLYLTEYVDSEAPYERYKTRLYDLAAGRLDPAIIVDKTGDDEEMAGFRQAAVASPDGQWLYSLYIDSRSHSPFVHVLNLNDGFAACIDLPGAPRGPAVNQMLWGMALAPDGKTVYAVNGTAGMAYEVDPAELKVRRRVELETSQAGGTLLDRLARLAASLTPVARAKMAPVNPVVLSPDGKTLYAVGATGLLVIDTADLAVRSHYLTDLTLNSLGVSHDGAVLYAVNVEPNRILRVNAETGEIVATLQGSDYWSGIVAISGTPTFAGVDADAAVPAACQVTEPQQPAFVPPAPYGPEPQAGMFWYGSEALWTELPVSGVWSGLPHSRAGYTQKTLWWQPGYDSQQEPMPDLVVTGRRLDGPAPALVSSLATNGHHDDLGTFMLAGVEVPAAGCWQITGRVGDEELSYVIWVAP